VTIGRFALTLATTNNEVLSGSAERTPNNKITLLLSLVLSDNFGRFNVKKLHHALGHVHQDVLAVPADIDACEIQVQADAVLLFPGDEIVDVDLIVSRDGNKSPAVRRDCTISDTIASRPFVELPASKVPEA
jgi:hypothetical protein